MGHRLLVFPSGSGGPSVGTMRRCPLVLRTSAANCLPKGLQDFREEKVVATSTNGIEFANYNLLAQVIYQMMAND